MTDGHELDDRKLSTEPEAVCSLRRTQIGTESLSELRTDFPLSKAVGAADVVRARVLLASLYTASTRSSRYSGIGRR